MTDERKQDILRQISELLNGIDEPTKTVAITAPEKVELLTIKECSEVVQGLNEYTVRQLIARKEIPSIRTGQGKNGKILVPKAALLAYFSGGAL